MGIGWYLQRRNFESYYLLEPNSIVEDFTITGTVYENYSDSDFMFRNSNYFSDVVLGYGDMKNKMK